MVRWLAERSKAGKESLYSLGVGEAEKLRNEIRQLQDSSCSGFRCVVAIHSSRSNIISNVCLSEIHESMPFRESSLLRRNDDACKVVDT